MGERKGKEKGVRKKGSSSRDSHCVRVLGLVEGACKQAPSTAKQLRRASVSVALNTSEGMYARGRARTHCYNIALREMRESYAALEVSVRLRYLAPLPAELEERIAHILGTLVRLSFPRRAAGGSAGDGLEPPRRIRAQRLGSMRRTRVPMTR